MPILDRFFHSSFYHWAERSHTVKFIGDAALWLWEKSPVWAGTLALVGPYFEGVPWTVAIAAGAVLAAALAPHREPGESLRGAQLARSVALTTAAAVDEDQARTPLSSAEASLSFIKNRDVTLTDLLVGEFRVRETF